METEITRRTHKIEETKRNEKRENPEVKLLPTLEKLNFKKSISKHNRYSITDFKKAIKMGFIDEWSRKYTLSYLGQRAVNYFGLNIHEIHAKNKKSKIFMFLTIAFMFLTVITLIFTACTMNDAPLYDIELTGAFIFTIISSIMALISTIYGKKSVKIGLINLNQLVAFFKHIHMSSKDIRCEMNIVRKYYQEFKNQ